MNVKAQALYDSLLANQFIPVSTKRWSHVALFKEFARRMSWWADSLGVLHNWLMMDIPYILELDELIDVGSMQKLDAHFKLQSLEQPMPTLLQSAFAFESLADHTEIKRFAHTNPYEPIIKLYLRGGYFIWNSRGFWEVSGAFGVGGIDIDTYKKPKPFVSMDEEELNLLDNENEPSMN